MLLIMKLNFIEKMQEHKKTLESYGIDMDDRVCPHCGGNCY